MHEPSSTVPVVLLDTLMQHYQRALYSFVRGLGIDDEQTCDLLQDTFYEAWRLIQRDAPPFASMHGEAEQRRWLFHVAYCRAVSSLRRKRRWLSLQTLLEIEHPCAPDAFADQIAEGEVLRAALGDLSAADAACVLLNMVQGFSSAEIAQIVGISAEAAKKRLARAKQRLRAAYFAHDSDVQEHGR
jgi:RNA polymerase sigma-70 factor (ECF subfamily)